MSDIAIVFPGQGSQYVGMGKKLYNRYSFVKEIFEEASDILGIDIKRLSFDEDINELTKTENVQFAILVASYANFKALIDEFGIKPALLAGHSLGEISALVCAEVIRFSDALKIVKVRGRLMQEIAFEDQGCMIAIMGMESHAISEVCAEISTKGHIVTIANYNSVDQTIISGHKAAVNEAIEKLELKGGRVMQINVNYPFHSQLMEPALEVMEDELKKYDYNPFKYPVLSSITALPYENEYEIVYSLANQIIKPVRWQETVEYIATLGIKTVIDIGPRAILRNLMQINDLDIDVFAYDDKKDKELIENKMVAADLAASIDRSIKCKLISKCLAIAVGTENSNWDNDAYKKGVLIPYRKIHDMLEGFEKANTEPLYKHMKASLDMLKTVFETKRTPKEEQEDRFKQVLYEVGLFELFSDFLV